MMAICVNAEISLNLRWTHIPYGIFSQVENNYSPFDKFWKVFFCLVLYTEINLQTFSMILCKTICRNYLAQTVLLWS